MQRRSLSRRSILASLPALAAVTGRAVSADRRDEDADARLVAAFARIQALNHAICEAPDDDAVIDELTDELSEVCAALAKRPAVTPAGLRAKAGAVRLECTRDRQGNLWRGATPIERLAWSLANDVLAGDRSTHEPAPRAG